jgi:hypothetical protein
VAALHRAQVKGATVRWNDIINGRQFDATVRFRDGLYEHLAVVECKDHRSSVSVGDVDAFATKSRDANANKAIMVAASGFESGCLTVAMRHGIELYTLKQAQSFSDPTLDTRFTPTIARNLRNVRLVLSADGNDVYQMPEDRNRLPYFLKHSLIEQQDGSQQSLQPVVLQAAKGLKSDFQERDAEIKFPNGTLVTLPKSKVGLRTFAVRFAHRLIYAYAVPGGLDSYTSTRLNAAVDYTNVITGTTEQFPTPHEIGFDTKMKVGGFYENFMGFYYYCNRIEGDLMWLDLIESYQHGELFQAWGAAQKLEHANYYVEVSDEKEVERLRTIVEQDQGRKA